MEVICQFRENTVGITLVVMNPREAAMATTSACSLAKLDCTVNPRFQASVRTSMSSSVSISPRSSD